MADLRTVARGAGGQSLFIDGYFSKRIWNGEEPDYGYSPNHAPTGGTAQMEVITGFVAWQRSKSKKK